MELEESDKRIMELDRAIEAIEIKKQGVERQFELSKKQMGDKILLLGE